MLHTIFGLDVKQDDPDFVFGPEDDPEETVEWTDFMALYFSLQLVVVVLLTNFAFPSSNYTLNHEGEPIQLRHEQKYTTDVTFNGNAWRDL